MYLGIDDDGDGPGCSAPWDWELRLGRLGAGRFDRAVWDSWGRHLALARFQWLGLGEL